MSRERKETLGTEEQRQTRLALARPKLNSVDKAKIKKIIASAITKYANEKIRPNAKEPMKMNKDDIPIDMRVKKGKEIGMKAVRDKFEQLDFNDEDILSLLSIVLQRSQIKALNLVAPLGNKDKLPTSVYTEMNRYIRQNATMVEELQSENTPLGELIKIVLTEPVDKIKKDVRRLGLSPMPMDKPEDKPEVKPEDVPEGKEPKDSDDDEPKKEKEGIDIEVEVPVMPKGGEMKTISKKKPKEDVVEIERETRSERLQRQQRQRVTLADEEKDILMKIIERINTNNNFKERFRKGALDAQRHIMQLEPEIARAVTSDQLNLISNTFHLRYLIDRYMNKKTIPQEIATNIFKHITNKDLNQLRLEGSVLPPQTLITDEPSVDKYVNLFEEYNDPDVVWDMVIGDLSDDSGEETGTETGTETETKFITTKGGKIPSIFERPPPTAPSGVTTKKIVVPDLKSEEKIKEQEVAKGTLRPKFISPSVNVLQPSEQDIQADFDEWAIFDFVQPVNNYGAEGNNENNPLKRMARVEEETIYRNAGIDLDPSLASVFTNREINTSNEAMAMDMLPPLMPDTSSQPRQVYDVSEYEVKSYDVNNDRTQIEYQSPYDNMTPIVLTNDEIRRSVLYGRVP